MSTMNAQWTSISGLLRQAGDIVRVEAGLPIPKASIAPGPLVGSLAEFETLLSHNEFELAWDALAAVAKRHQSTSVVWLLLARAGLAMGLRGHTKAALKELERALPLAVSSRGRLIYQVRRRTGGGKARWGTPHVLQADKGVTA